MVVLIGLAVHLSNRSSPASVPVGRDAAGDVTVVRDSCVDDAGAGRVQVEVSNSTHSRADYVIELSFVDPSGQSIGNALAVIRKVGRGRAARGVAAGMLLDDATLVECRVTEVVRTASI